MVYLIVVKSYDEDEGQEYSVVYASTEKQDQAEVFKAMQLSSLNAYVLADIPLGELIDINLGELWSISIR